MKRVFLGVLLIGILILTFVGCPIDSIAEVKTSIGVNVGPPPPVVIASPPPVVVVPGTHVYAVPDVEADIFFYHGYWYRPYQGRWYRAAGYNGPWAYIKPVRTPAVLLYLPPDYHRMPPSLQRIPYWQLEKNWRVWEKEKHWDRHKVKKVYSANKGKGKHRDD